MKYLDVVRGEHFNNLAAMIRVAWRKQWHDEHPEVPFWTLEKAFSDAVMADATWDRNAVLEGFVTLITRLVEADPALCWYTEEDMNWFVQTLDAPDGKTILTLFCAMYSAPDSYLTPAEVAAATDTAESGWRNKANAGEIPGAIKKGKQWLLPRAVLIARGILNK